MRKKVPIKDITSVSIQRKGQTQEVLKKYSMESRIRTTENINNMISIVSVMLKLIRAR